MLLLSIYLQLMELFLILISFRVEVKMAVNIRVKVHPVVLFQIADSYERRSQDNHRQVMYRTYILLVSSKFSTLVGMKVPELRIHEFGYGSGSPYTYL
jgi:hypothetical protein